jgi:hypothetical protein
MTPSRSDDGRKPTFSVGLIGKHLLDRGGEELLCADRIWIWPAVGHRTPRMKPQEADGDEPMYAASNLLQTFPGGGLSKGLLWLDVPTRNLEASAQDVGEDDRSVVKEGNDEGGSGEFRRGDKVRKDDVDRVRPRQIRDVVEAERRR